MKKSRFLLYASLIIVLTGGAIWYIISGYNDRQEAVKTDIVMYKNPGCQCCDKWAAYMQNNGYSVSIIKSPDLPSVKAEQKVPRNMSACHTALINGYVVEGHVPVEDVRKLLKEKPDAIGIAVPGMPASSPGMNTAMGQSYQSYLLKSDGSSQVYSHH